MCAWGRWSGIGDAGQACEKKSGYNRTAERRGHAHILGRVVLGTGFSCDVGLSTKRSVLQVKDVYRDGLFSMFRR